MPVSDLHEALKKSQLGRNESFVARVEGMNNFSVAIVDQNLVVPQVANLLSFRKFTFERDLSKAMRNEKFYVNCLVGHSMCQKRNEWSQLNRTEGYVGVFLKGPPAMSRASPVQTKVFSQRDMESFKKRLRLTEGRISDMGKTKSLRVELERVESQTIAPPDWAFSRLRTLAILTMRRRRDRSHCEDEEEEPVQNGLTYEVGEMVTVNHGAERTSATPFWLGKIDDVSTSVNGEKNCPCGGTRFMDAETWKIFVTQELINQ